MSQDKKKRKLLDINFNDKGQNYMSNPENNLGHNSTSPNSSKITKFIKDKVNLVSPTTRLTKNYISLKTKLDSDPAVKQASAKNAGRKTNSNFKYSLNSSAGASTTTNRKIMNSDIKNIIASTGNNFHSNDNNNTEKNNTNLNTNNRVNNQSAKSNNKFVLIKNKKSPSANRSGETSNNYNHNYNYTYKSNSSSTTNTTNNLPNKISSLTTSNNNNPSLNENRSEINITSPKFLQSSLGSPKTNDKPSKPMINSSINDFRNKRLIKFNYDTLDNPIPLTTGNDRMLNDNLNYFKYNNLDPAKKGTKQTGVISTFGVNTHYGTVRDYNEDRVSIILNVVNPYFSSTAKWPKTSLFGIYDGHGGHSCAEFLKENLHQYVMLFIYIIIVRYLDRRTY